jgi:hypothetical protein
MSGAKILYKSGDVYRAIQKLFSIAKGRRVAVAAFVGADAGDFLPNADGVEVFCWPKPGSTSAAGILKLQKRGAVVRLVDRLHSKVYWAEGRGAVVASANLSRSALGAKSLVETGVLLPEGALDIDKMLSQLKPRDVTSADLLKLRKATPIMRRGSRSGGIAVSFTEWLKDGPANWKWGWYERNVENANSTNAVAWAKDAFGVPEPHDTYFCGVKKVKPHDWLLVVRLGEKTPIRKAEWVYVNHVVVVPPKEKRLYDRRWPRQAVQAQSLKSCPTPPFEIDRRFLAALKGAARDWGEKRFRKQVNDKKPTIAFLKKIASHEE